MHINFIDFWKYFEGFFFTNCICNTCERVEIERLPFFELGASLTGDMSSAVRFLAATFPGDLPTVVFRGLVASASLVAPLLKTITSKI